MTDLEIRQMTDFQGGDDDAVVCLGGFVMPDLRLGQSLSLRVFGRIRCEQSGVYSNKSFLCENEGRGCHRGTEIVV